MALLNNPRHERFAQLVAGGASLTNAYTSCGFSSTNAASGASRLAKSEKVRGRIEELQADFATRGANHAEITRAAILRGLIAIAENKDEPAGARIRAYELCGKEHGMFGDRSEVRTIKSLADIPDDVLEQAIAEGERLEALQLAKEKKPN